jgi:hypothetical protein
VALEWTVELICRFFDVQTVRVRAPGETGTGGAVESRTGRSPGRRIGLVGTIAIKISVGRGTTRRS